MRIEFDWLLVVDDSLFVDADREIGVPKVFIQSIFFFEFQAPL